MKRAFHRRIGDQVAIVVLDTAVLEPVDDLYAEASHVAANMGMLADLMDEATVNIELAEGAHKAVRGQIAVDLLEVSPDLAQWRVEKHLDADARVVQGLSHIARAKGDLAFLKTFHDALRLQSSMVRARAEMLRVERGAQPSVDDEENDTRTVTKRPRAPYKGSSPKDDDYTQQKRSDAAWRAVRSKK